MSCEGWFVPSNIFAGSFLHAAADNIDINEEAKSGERTTHVLGSVMYQAKRDNAPLLPSGVVASDTGIRAVKNLTMFNLRDTPNTHQKLKTLHHLVEKDNMKEWLYRQKPTTSMDRALIFLQIMPSKIIQISYRHQVLWAPKAISGDLSAGSKVLCL